MQALVESWDGMDVVFSQQRRNLTRTHAAPVMKKVAARSILQHIARDP